MRPQTVLKPQPRESGAAGLAVTGWSLHLPDADVPRAVARHGIGEPAGWAREEACPPERAADLLGRRGLLYKEPATRLALCAVHRALGLPPRHRPDGPPDPGTAVVACANLGNVATLAEVVRTVDAEGGRSVSPLMAPNASSNVVASTVALWFRFGGPNLMVCSGATAGLDALWLAGLLLRAGRAERVVVVGAEPADEVAGAMHKAAGGGASLRAGAACLIVHPGGREVGGRRSASDADIGTPRVFVDPPPPADGGPVIGPGGFDPAEYWGDQYGAQGLVSVALAAHLVADEGLGPMLVRCGGEPDGWRTARVMA